MNWKKARKNIPNKVRTAPRKSFEVLWANGLTDSQGNKLYGKTEFVPNRIIINNEQTDRESVLTTFHEFLHAIDHDNEIGLTETQVEKLELSFNYLTEFVLKLEGKKK
jgi:Zn-dependent peptidase ImmA (M78 family)